MDIYKTSKPLTRWWWFRGELNNADIARQLDWMAECGFGGAEIAWVYPLADNPGGPKWLSAELNSHIQFAKDHAHKLGLVLDFTFGTLWPFGGSFVDDSMASRTYQGLSPQRIRKSWEEPEHGPVKVLNHLSVEASNKYFDIISSGLPLDGEKQCLFCDSWEVATEGLWCDDFQDVFKSRFGYDILPLMDELDSHEDARYDYRKLISELTINRFYRTFTNWCNNHNSFSRVQVHGAPCDLVAGYAVVDVPESEAILFDPHFSQFAASSATISGKNIVTAETFTCLYGWKGWPGPGQHQGEEQIADLKLLADAMFANGVNLPIWHGMPYSPKGAGKSFYASVHVGEDSSFVKDLKPFNDYMAKVAGFMQEGKNYTSCACYLPFEDNLMANLLPDELKRPSAKYYYELHYQRFPNELQEFRPCWISGQFLKDAVFDGKKLHIGNAEFDFLHVDVKWLDSASLDEILRLANDGLPICFVGNPKRPGKNPDSLFLEKVNRLKGLKNVSDSIDSFDKYKLALGHGLPEYWARVCDNKIHIFFAHPKSKELYYPMKYGQAFCNETIEKEVRIKVFGHSVTTKLVFQPYQSLLLTINKDGSHRFEDIFLNVKVPAIG